MADGISTLNPLNWGTSVAESTLTLGVDRLDFRPPPDQYHLWHAQITALKNLLLAMSATFKGGGRLGVLPQSSNPFGASETGFYADNSATPLPLFSSNGAVKFLVGGTSAGGIDAGANQLAFTSSIANGATPAFDFNVTNTFSNNVEWRIRNNGTFLFGVYPNGATTFFGFDSGVTKYFSFNSSSNVFQFNTVGGVTPATDNNTPLGATTARWQGLYNSGPLGGKYNTQSGTSYTILAGDHYVGMSNSGVRTVTLCAANAFYAGQELIVKDENGNAGTNNVTINRAGSDTIDGGTSLVINTNKGRAVLVSDGVSKWFQVN